ncbi:hypothetical protein KKF81_02770 [Candidatus Micrarchaeota archaeon]|nr:hypothetical protein [Candidatus Micrarchaeota archaeon]
MMNVKFIYLLFAFVLVFGCIDLFIVNECYNYAYGHRIFVSSPQFDYITMQTGGWICIFDQDLNLFREITAYHNFIWINDTTFIIDMNGSENCLDRHYCLWIQNINKSTPDKIIPLPFEEEPDYLNLRHSHDEKYVFVIFAHNISIYIYDQKYNRTVVDIERGVVLNTTDASLFISEMPRSDCHDLPSEGCGSYIFSVERYGVYSYGRVAISHDGESFAIPTPAYSEPNSDNLDYSSYYDGGGKDITVYRFSADNKTLTLIKKIMVGMDKITGNRKHLIKKMEYSPDDRYIAISGSYSISDGPDWGQISGLGYVVIVDTKTEKIIFRDDGGSLSGANYAHFAWTQNGKMLYLFDGETIREIHRIDPENPVKEKPWWEIF